jgi:cellulose synthase/poly-beta-1,6-N-acetylglucosamine synthase-like glycosyltransferase
MTTVGFILLLPGLLLALFVGHGFLTFLLSLVALASKRGAAALAPSETRFVVLVPAHDEELLIEQTVRGILDADVAGRVDLVVIADNCSDGTAEIARSSGARCLERKDETRKGKPYALDWAIRQLDLADYDALVIIDADTRIHKDFFSAMSGHLGRGSKVLQGYFGVLNPDQNWLTRLSLLPATLKFKLHFPGKELLGLSCPLAGNGMCFAIDVIKRYGWNAYSLTENWEYWAMLTLEGLVVSSARDAVIYSQVAKSLDAAQSQRLRWMRGRIDVARSYGRRLLLAGLLEPSAVKLDAFVELSKPTHALLLLWSLAYLAITGLAWSLDRAYVAPATLAAAILVAYFIPLFSAFVLDRPPLKTWLALLMVPRYLLWKLLLSARGVIASGERAWTRTRRHE